MTTIETFTHANRTVKICYDPEPYNPRDEWDNLTTIAHWHRRYRFDRENIKIEPCAAEEVPGDILAILPLGLVDHSGLSVNNSFGGCWDSGQVGWIYVTRESARKMGCEDWPRERLEEAIRGETETLDQYLRGEVYGYVIEGAAGDTLDSCWGFFGDLDYVRQEARSAAEHAADPAVDHAAATLENRATYAAG